METTYKKKKGAIKLIAFVLIVLLIVALNHYYGWSDIFSGDDWYGNLQQMVKTNFLQAALIYIVVMVIASVVLAVPGVTFAIIAGGDFRSLVGHAALRPVGHLGGDCRLPGRAVLFAGQPAGSNCKESLHQPIALR